MEQECAPIYIKPEMLSQEVLNSLIEEFVLREGTNYGDIEHNLETKVAQVLQQIKNGKAHIVFDPESESVTLVTNL